MNNKNFKGGEFATFKNKVGSNKFKMSPQKIEWHANRLLSKLNYIVHTDAVKNYIVPTLTEEQKRFVYAEEADVLNVALFGMTIKEWEKKIQNLQFPVH